MSYAWFLIIYILLGIVLLWMGYILAFHPNRMVNYLVKTAQSGQQPRLIIRWLKYFLMFSLASLIAGFFPFYLTGILFSLACLVLTFILGRMLLMWDQVREILPEKQSSLTHLAQKTGYLMLTLSVLCFILWYMHINHI